MSFMPFGEKNLVLTTEEAVRFLRISKPTFLKYVRTGRIRAVKAGSGYRVLYPELLRFLNTPDRSRAVGGLNKGENAREPVGSLENNL